MAEPVVFMVDVRAADASAPEGGFEATVRRTDAASAVLQVTDLGVVRGDGVFETLGVVGGHPQSVEAHLARLANSAQLLELPEPNLEQWRVAIRLAAQVLPADRQGGIKLVLTRGIEGTGVPTGWVTASLAGSSFDERRTGLRVVTLDRGYPSETAARSPWLLAGAKTLSYAVNMAAQREAKRRGAGDAIFVSSDGYVMEAPTSTVIIRNGNTFSTPRTDIGILPGTAQIALFEFFRAAGFAVEQKLIPADELTGADALWLVSSVRLASPITHIDGAEITHDVDMTRRMNEVLLARDA